MAPVKKVIVHGILGLSCSHGILYLFLLVLFSSTLICLVRNSSRLLIFVLFLIELEMPWSWRFRF